MGVSSKILITALIVMLLSVLFYQNGQLKAKSSSKGSIEVSSITTTNLSSDASNRITSIIQSEVSKCHKNNKYSYLLTGLASRMDDLYVITLKLKNKDADKVVKKVTKNSSSTFENFINNTVRDATKSLLDGIE